MTTIENLNWDAAGLIPAVVQDAATGEVLTVAYVSAESLARARELGETVFYSRSRGVLWHKGETSGHTQAIAGLMADCDKDAVVVRVRPRGPACHTGARSCFFEPVEGFAPAGAGIGEVLGGLEKVVRQRREQMPEGSYTTRLFREGRKRIFQKVGEEATETVVAGLGGDRGETTREAADLLYHLVVALCEMDVSLEDVAKELESRRR